MVELVEMREYTELLGLSWTEKRGALAGTPDVFCNYQVVRRETWALEEDQG